jgi:hypothetical protein
MGKLTQSLLHGETAEVIQEEIIVFTGDYKWDTRIKSIQAMLSDDF